MRSAGIDPVTGREIYIKKDGTTTFDWSAADQVVCGDTQPKVNGNIGANFSTYGFDFSFTFTYRLGGQTYNSTLVEKIENADVKNWNGRQAGCLPTAGRPPVFRPNIRV